VQRQFRAETRWQIFVCNYPLDDGCRIKKHESDAIYPTHEVAVMSGMKYLEAKGVVNINLHAVVSLVHK
jgi:hypothetical protein